MIVLANAVSLTFFSSFLIPLILYIQTYDLFYIKLIGGLVAANAAVEIVKPLFGRSGFYGRPVGATACDAFCIRGPVGGRPGFPSGHMTNVSMLVAALWWHTQSPAILVIGIPWIAAMAWARYTKQCHNWQQIVAGIFTGACFGGLINYI